MSWSVAGSTTPCNGTLSVPVLAGEKSQAEWPMVPKTNQIMFMGACGRTSTRVSQHGSPRKKVLQLSKIGRNLNPTIFRMTESSTRANYGFAEEVTSLVVKPLPAA